MALQEADYGMTELAMTGNQSRYHGDETLFVLFFIHPKLNQTLSDAMERPIYEDTEYIQIITPGNKDNIIRRPAMDMDKTRFAEHYKRFKARQDQEIADGTPLSEWPAITRSQAAELGFFNIHTVEQLANVSDSNAQNIMGFGSLQEKAKKFLDQLKDSAAAEHLENELADRDEKIAELMARLEAVESGEIGAGSGDVVDQAEEESPAEESQEEPETEAPAGRRRKRK